MSLSKMSKILPLIAVTAFAANAAMAAPARQPGLAAEISDPIEPVNRAVFGFNKVIDSFVFRPVAIGYRYITPQVVRTHIGNVSDNLYEPVNMLNSFLQGDFTQGMTTFWRFLINSTIGIAGINDVATEAGLPRRSEDFGQTLGVWGLGSGPYIVLPLLGPSNLRDTAGMIGDYFSYPPNYYLESDDEIWLAVGQGLIKRERLIEPIDDVYSSSLDPYVSFRSIYTQHRAAQIDNRNKNGDTAVGVGE